MAGRPADKERDRDREKERKQTCVGCKKKFTKSDYCVICGMCNFWYHKTCAGISDDIYKCIETYYKENSHTFWNCMPCSTYAKGITARMRELEGRIESVEKHQDEQDQELKTVNSKVDSTNKEVKKLAKKIEEAKSGANVLQELKERKNRRLNVILYGIGEAPGENPTLDEKRTWDKKSCQNVFNALKLKIESNTLRFIRRIGEKGEKPRPLLIGMENMEDKDRLLANAKYLRDTHLNRVGISPDLTPMELQEERDLAAEAEKRNKNLSEEDQAKNMKWLVVGQKGEKRLFKGIERTQPGTQGPPPASKPNQTGRRVNGPQPTQRQRISSKRGLSGSDSEGETSTQPRLQKKKKQQKQASMPTPTAQSTTESDSSEMEEEMNRIQIGTATDAAADAAATMVTGDL